MIDVHVHLAALPTPANSCRLSARMRKRPLVRYLAWQNGYDLDDAEETNLKYIERLIDELSRSRQVEQAVLLALDGVYDAQGKLDEGLTDFLVSNDCLFEAVSADPRFLAGVSINPARRDALDELSRCAEKGAVLVKVLANVQCFDPAEHRFAPFYRKMAELGLPFLSHVGREYSLHAKDQSLGDPQRLRLALDEGVTVIAAHACSHGIFLYERYLKTMLDLVRRYPRFYMDTSALTIPNRVGMLFKIRKYPELFDRLVFGTDYPVPVYPYPCLGTLSWNGYRRARAADNRFDRHARVLETLGIPSIPPPIPTPSFSLGSDRLGSAEASDRSRRE
jgi:predicted TIM-barrel fold metal-dependent hydrolase